MSECIKSFVDAQREFPTIRKDAQNPFFKSNYATFDAIVSTVRPILAKHGLAFTQTIADGTLQTTIHHASGESLTSAIPFTATAAKPQDLGSAISYAKRYGLQMALGLSLADDDTDDDGARAQRRATPATPRAQPMVELAF